MAEAAEKNAPDDWSNADKVNADQEQRSGDPLNRDNPPVYENEQHARRTQVVAENEPFRDSGKEIGLIKPPIVSLNPTSNTSADEPEKFEVFDNANRYLNHTGPKYDFKYPFVDMDIGQGFFVPLNHGQTIDKLINHLHSSINAFHRQTSVEEKDENGDDVWETVTTLPKKRNSDGTIQLSGDGSPIVGANHTNRPKLVHMAQFVIKPAVKDDELAEGRKADSDGALVIRVA